MPFDYDFPEPRDEVPIYVDQLTRYGKRQWCHMWTVGGEGTDDLHDFAEAIGLRREWAQTSRASWGEFHHYDLTPSKRKLALEHGAVEQSLLEWVAMMKAAFADASDASEEDGV